MTFVKWLAAVVAAAGVSGAALTGQAQAAPPPKPRLVVAISVDQFSANLYEQWRPQFTGGLKTLSSGIVYPAGYQSHAATETCPGHSTLLTGKHPNKTGIVGNDLRDPATGKMVYCLYDPSKALAHGGSDPPVGPARLMATTLGDWLKASSPASRVVAVSSKDRGAINMAGHSPDAVFWLKTGYGFTTYMEPGSDPAKALAPLAGLNAELGPIWKQRPRWELSSPTCRGLDADWDVGGLTFHSKVPPAGWGQSEDPATVARDYGASPLPDELTLKAALRLLADYKLGRGPAVDLLAVSFSATDYVGHRYGTRGPEMCDQMHRLDALIGQLVAALDAAKTPYVVVLSADHGGSDLAERLASEGYPARRVNGPAAFAEVKAAVGQELGLPSDAVSGSLEEVYIKTGDPAQRRLIAEATKRALLARPEVAAAFTLDELLATTVPKGKPADELTVQERFAESAYAGRSADVLAALQPYSSARVAGPGSNVAGHGSVWNYDRRVPILFWWKGAPSETRFLPVETVDIAPTLASLLGLQAPGDLDGRPLDLNH